MKEIVDCGNGITTNEGTLKMQSEEVGEGERSDIIECSGCDKKDAMVHGKSCQQQNLHKSSRELLDIFHDTE